MDRREGRILEILSALSSDDALQETSDGNDGPYPFQDNEGQVMDQDRGYTGNTGAYDI